MWTLRRQNGRLVLEGGFTDSTSDHAVARRLGVYGLAYPLDIDFVVAFYEL
jgi:hypothetical protein